MNIVKKNINHEYINCTSKEEVNALFDTYDSIYSSNGEELWEHILKSYLSENTTFEMWNNQIVGYSEKHYYLRRNLNVIEFKDFFKIKEEPSKTEQATNYMIAEEVLDWLVKNYHETHIFTEVFGANYTYNDLFNKFSNREIVDKIQDYEMNHKYIYEILDSKLNRVAYTKTEKDAKTLCMNVLNYTYQKVIGDLNEQINK